LLLWLYSNKDEGRTIKVKKNFELIEEEYDRLSKIKEMNMTKNEWVSHKMELRKNKMEFTTFVGVRDNAQTKDTVESKIITFLGKKRMFPKVDKGDN